MRHRRRGRKLGRSPSHQRALLRNLASALFLTEREDDEYLEGPQMPDPPKVKGRIVTTLQKAKEVRPLVEKCITIARRSLDAQRAADALDTDADRYTEEWKKWRESDQYNQWNQAVAPVLAARRRAIKLLGDKRAVQILFDEIAPRFEDRNGGYTRVLRLAKPRLGDGGTQAILEFVGVRDRVQQKSVAPAFDAQDDAPADAPAAEVEEEVKEVAAAEEAVSEETAADAPATEESSEESKE